jgi:hypothetical protein
MDATMTEEMKAEVGASQVAVDQTKAALAQ